MGSGELAFLVAHSNAQSGCNISRLLIDAMWREHAIFENTLIRGYRLPDTVFLKYQSIRRLKS